MEASVDSVEVKCLACFRTEQWTPSSRQVVFAGGMRKLAVPAALHQWRIAVKCASGEHGVIVAACPACAQPMVVLSGEWQPIRWEIAGEPGPIAILGRDITDGGVAADIPALSARIEAAHRSRFNFKPIEVAFGLFMLWAMIMLVCLWVFAASFAINFIVHALPVYDPR